MGYGFKRMKRIKTDQIRNNPLFPSKSVARFPAKYRKLISFGLLLLGDRLAE
jgi:hypothetical protein